MSATTQTPLVCIYCRERPRRKSARSCAQCEDDFRRDGEIITFDGTILSRKNPLAAQKWSDRVYPGKADYPVVPNGNGHSQEGSGMGDIVALADGDYGDDDLDDEEMQEIDEDDEEELPAVGQSGLTRKRAPKTPEPTPEPAPEPAPKKPRQARNGKPRTVASAPIGDEAITAQAAAIKAAIDSLAESASLARAIPEPEPEEESARAAIERFRALLPETDVSALQGLAAMMPNSPLARAIEAINGLLSHLHQERQAAGKRLAAEAQGRPAPKRAPASNGDKSVWPEPKRGKEFRSALKELDESDKVRAPLDAWRLFLQSATNGRTTLIRGNGHESELGKLHSATGRPIAEVARELGYKSGAEFARDLAAHKARESELRKRWREMSARKADQA